MRPSSSEPSLKSTKERIVGLLPARGAGADLGLDGGGGRDAAGLGAGCGGGRAGLTETAAC